jgi:lipopolysaccharide/colanic/teichoic acid biosynthesis glycosyltransferase
MSGKRSFDVAAAAFLLLTLSPLLVLLALLVRVLLGSPVFFVQSRPGRHGRSFRMIKFRTMTNTRAADGTLASDESRLTRFGRLLRTSSLDELPELWNVLKGDMSIVGPRPLLLEYLPLYSLEQARRHEVRPGMTGWAQVNGRNALAWEDKFRLDVWYVDHRSFLLDLRIILLTMRKVLTREGITAEGNASAEKFTGGVH